MTISGSDVSRRHRLLDETQGRSLDEAYLHQSIRADLEAEAADPGPDPLITPAMLDHLCELMAEKEAMAVESGASAAGPEFFLSTETVVIVPGFLASALSDLACGGHGLIWVDPLAAVAHRLGALQLGPCDGREEDLDPRVRITATGPVPILYDLLRLALEVRRYTTEIFPVDWRKDLGIAAQRLVDRLRTLTSESRRSIHLVAHSQGALVARRALQLLGSDEARQIVRHLVLLGPANFGSFSAAMALGGGHCWLSLARKLAIEPPQGFHQVLASMTGIYQLLPWDRSRVPWLSEYDLGQASFWKAGIDAARLTRFYGWGRAIDTHFFDDQTTVIVGDNYGVPTVGGVGFDGLVLREWPSHGLAGDGTVPHSCAVLPGVRTFLVPRSEHSMLGAHRGAINAVLDVLADRHVSLPHLSSDPAAHLKPATAPTLLAAPAIPAPEIEPVPIRSAAPTSADLNGTFLSSYDDREAEPESTGSALLHRQDQLRVDHEPYEILELQSTTGDVGVPNYELILDESNLLPFDFLRTGDRLGRTVVKIQRADGGAGTGFLVAPDILLTNNHVLPDFATAAAARALANYEASPPDGIDGRLAVGLLDPNALFLTNADLDFTFCAIRGLDFLGAVPLNRNSLNIIQAERVNIIQHPRGGAKQVVVQSNRVVRADNIVVRYSCDTEPGSSGSPVFNNQWKLVALHHASVIADREVGRTTPGGDPSARYLNEGIRLSAIATWLEMAEANAPERRDQVVQLRSIFDGIDPQTGFFGALGRKARGKSAAEAVVDSYRADADDLDVAFWDLGRPGLPFRERIPEVGRVIAEMNMDLWCLEGISAEGARALCDFLRAKYQLNYGFPSEPVGMQPDLAVLYRRTKELSVVRLAPAADGPDAPAGVSARTTTRRGEAVAFHLVPVSRTVAAGDGDGDEPPAPIRALLGVIGRPEGDADWIVAGALPAPGDVVALTRAGYALVAAASEADGAIGLFLGPGSHVEQVFVSPNLDPTAGPPEVLVVTRDRELPREVQVLGRPRPIAIRLALNGKRAPAPAKKPEPPPKSEGPAERQASPTTAPAVLTDADLEQKLRDMLGPILAKLLAETRP